MRLLFLAGLAATATVFTACGGSDDSTTDGGAAVTADQGAPGADLGPGPAPGTDAAVTPGPDAAAPAVNTCTNPPTMLAAPDAGESDALVPDAAHPNVTCNLLENCAGEIHMSNGHGAEPQGSGGTIQDGLYVLTGWLVYPAGNAITSVTARGTMLVTGDTWEQSAQQLDQTATMTLTVTTSGSDLTRNYTCPGAHTDSRKYTVDGDNLLLIQPDIGTTKVEEWTRLF